MKLQFHQGGVFLPELNLWLDAHHRVTDEALVFVSHAHADHTRAHREVILTPPTAALMRARIGGKREEHLLEFGQTREFSQGASPFRITLLPAGHVLGSAMALVESGGRSLLYTGDFKLERGLSCEPCDPSAARGVDVLIMETTFGRPEYRFPAGSEVMAGMRRFCRETLSDGGTPLVLGYSLGKSQEILRGLMGEGMGVMVHKAVYAMTRIYEEFGVKFPEYELFEPADFLGKVLIGPPNTMVDLVRADLGKVRTAMMTGWAVNPGRRYGYGADVAFPLSDHADFPGLIETVRRVAPGRVYTLHGFAADFAQTLRELGIEAEALSELDQPHLDLGFRAGASPPGERRRSSPSGGWRRTTRDERVEGSGVASFGRFAELVTQLAQLPPGNRKAGALAAFLPTADRGSLACVLGWLAGAGTAAPIGWVVFREALGIVRDHSTETLERVCVKHADVGNAVAELLGAEGGESTLTVDEIETFLGAARVNRRNGVAALVPVLARATPAEGRVIARLAGGDLRVGVSTGLLLEAVAKGWGQTVEEVGRAYRLSGDLGGVIAWAEEGSLAEVSIEPFRPTRVGIEAGAPAWCELHCVGDRVAVYTADRRDVGDAVPGVVKAVKRLGVDLVLSGRMVGERDGESLAAVEVVECLGSGQPDLFQDASAFRFVASDLLWLEGAALLELEPVRRLARLRELMPGGNTVLPPPPEPAPAG